MRRLLTTTTLKAYKAVLAKEKARETTSLATTKDQVNEMLGKYTDSHFYSPEPKQRFNIAIQELPNHNNWPNNLIS
jgi:hypothetical protein